jgi:hypothetical protein
MIQHPDERIDRNIETSSKLRPGGHSCGNRVSNPKRRRHPHYHRRNQVGRSP